MSVSRIQSKKPNVNPLFINKIPSIYGKSFPLNNGVAGSRVEIEDAYGPAYMQGQFDQLEKLITDPYVKFAKLVEGFIGLPNASLYKPAMLEVNLSSRMDAQNAAITAMRQREENESIKKRFIEDISLLGVQDRYKLEEAVVLPISETVEREKISLIEEKGYDTVNKLNAVLNMELFTKLISGTNVSSQPLVLNAEKLKNYATEIDKIKKTENADNDAALALGKFKETIFGEYTRNNTFNISTFAKFNGILYEMAVNSRATMSTFLFLYDKIPKYIMAKASNSYQEFEKQYALHLASKTSSIAALQNAGVIEEMPKDPSKAAEWLLKNIPSPSDAHLRLLQMATVQTSVNTAQYAFDPANSGVVSFTPTLIASVLKVTRDISDEHEVTYQRSRNYSHEEMIEKVDDMFAEAVALEMKINKAGFVSSTAITQTDKRIMRQSYKRLLRKIIARDNQQIPVNTFSFSDFSYLA